MKQRGQRGKEGIHMALWHHMPLMARYGNDCTVQPVGLMSRRVPTGHAMAALERLRSAAQRSLSVVSSYCSAQGASLDFVEEEGPFDPF